MQQHILIALTLVLGITLSGCAGIGGSGHMDVKAVDNQFQPNSSTVKQNQMMEWHNEGSNQHTVTIHKVGDGVTTHKKDTPIAPSAATSYTFQETGTYHVFCKNHSGGTAGSFSSGMVMTVTVE